MSVGRETPGSLEAKGPSPAEAVDNRGSRTVLIVDDHDDVRHILRLLFEIEDFRVVGEAADGDEALEMAREFQPTFVILDYLMPNMTGEQTAKWIRLVDPGAHIIAVSGVVHETPSWAEVFVRKTDAVELIQLPETLMAQASRRSDHLVSD